MAKKSADDAAGKEHPGVRKWLDEIDAAKKREKDYRQEGKGIIDVYSGRKRENTPYNILYSNTEVLLPALYSMVPRPVVQRRFKDEDPVGKAAAHAGQRVLEFLLDTNIDGYETFDEAMRASVLDALLPGRGITSVKYDAEIEEEYKTGELVCTESRQWNRVFFGYATKWSQVPWVAYEEYVDKEEAVRLFGKEMAGNIRFTTGNQDRDNDDYGDGPEKNDQGTRKTACIYQIWDKEGGRKVRYISEQYPEGYLKEEDDPLELTGFFNCPRPIMFLEKTSDMVPTALYELYKNQAQELNRLTIRINRIVEAVKARGAYDGELGADLAKILEGDDNTLIAADRGSSLAAEKGFANAIWMVPIEQLVNVLAQLYQAREQCKRVIYEITGISDIIRGSTVASETATAQEIKSQWGTLRLKRLQKEVQRYARDLLRIMLEIASTKFSEETWAKMTGLPFLTESQSAQIQMIAMQSQATGAPIDPATQAELQKPRWSDVMAMLRDDMQRAYRVDIETNTTIEPEAAEDQKNIGDVMNAMSQFMNGVGPLVLNGTLPFEAAQSMMLAVARRFRFGTEIEDQLKGMKQPEVKDEGAAKEKAAQQAEMQKSQIQQQSDQAKIQLEQQKIQVQVQIESAKLAAAQQLKQAELAAQMELEEMKARIQQETELRKAEITAQKDLEVAQITAQKDENVAAQNANAVANAANPPAESVKREEASEERFGKIVEEIVETQNKIIEMIAAPRETIPEHGADGKIVKIYSRVAA